METDKNDRLYKVNKCSSVTFMAIELNTWEFLHTNIYWYEICTIKCKNKKGKFIQVMAGATIPHNTVSPITTGPHHCQCLPKLFSDCKNTLLQVWLGWRTNMTEIGKGKIMDWINITTLLRIVDLRCHDYNNKQMVKVRERLWSCFIQKNQNVYSQLEMENRLLC